MADTLQFATETLSISPVQHPNPFDSPGLDLGLLTFDSRFQTAIRESLHTGTAVEIRPGGLAFPANDAELPRFCERALDGCPLKIEVRLLNGRCIRISLQWRIAGESSCLSVLATDITAQKQAEEEQLATVQQLQDGFDGALEGIYRVSPDGRLLFANLSLARMLGYDTAQDVLSAIGDVGRDLWADPADRSEYLRVIDELGTVEGFECRLKRRDVAEFWASLNTRKICGRNGDLHYLEGFIQDITDKKAAEKKLRDSEERYRASFEQAAVGIVHTSFEGRILRCNRRFAEIVGYAPHELAGTTFQEITPPGDRPPGRSAFEQLISGAVANAALEKRYVRKDGTLTWVMLSITTQRDSEGRPLHFITMV